MKYLFALLLFCICFQTNAQQRYGSAYKDDKPERNMLLLEGGYSMGATRSDYYTATGITPISKPFTDYEIALGYRYCMENARLGLNVTYAISGALLVGLHSEFPIHIGDKFSFAPGINLIYGSLFQDSRLAQFVPAASLGVMYKFSEAVAFNLEGGYRLFFQKANGYEIPLRAGFRFLF